VLKRRARPHDIRHRGVRIGILRILVVERGIRSDDYACIHPSEFLSQHIGSGPGVSGLSGMQVKGLVPSRSVRIPPSAVMATMVAALPMAGGAAGPGQTWRGQLRAGLRSAYKGKQAASQEVRKPWGMAVPLGGRWALCRIMK